MPPLSEQRFQLTPAGNAVGSCSAQGHDAHGLLRCNAIYDDKLPVFEIRRCDLKQIFEGFDGRSPEKCGALGGALRPRKHGGSIEV
jgi:hypothetical protein